jgi:hypothetical protein
MTGKKLKLDPRIFKNQSSQTARSAGIPVKTKLVFYKQEGKRTEKFAEAGWDVEKNEWQFSGDDANLIDWLKGVFAQPIIGKAAATRPNMTLQPDSMAFVYHLKDVIMPRKKIIMKIEN